MSAFVPMRVLNDCVFAYGCTNGHAVLKAYFDDSGTHNGADAIAMGGLIGRADEWAALEVDWRAALADFGIQKMRMASCENARDEFLGWSRDRRDAAIARFRDIISRRKLMILFSAVSRKAWDGAASRTIIADIFGQPIDFCFNTCIQNAIRTSRTDGSRDEPIAVIFDSRDESLTTWSRVSDGYKSRYPKVAGYSFSSMTEVLPLQAADMVAYEAFVAMCDVRKRDGAMPNSFRDNFEKLTDAVPTRGAFHTEDQLVAYVEELLRG